jgi:hypothetical protein
MSDISLVKSNYVTVAPTNIKRASKFTCMGWISNIQIPDEFPMYLLTVSDVNGIVLSDQAIRMEIKKYGDFDYKLQFSNSESKPIEQYTNISLGDKKWHLLTYVCFGEGEMHYYVDGIECPSEDGVGDEGIPYSVAWSRSHRLGGGNIWVPYLYRDWQVVTMYRWRYSSGLVLHQGWINELRDIEQPLEPVIL